MAKLTREEIMERLQTVGVNVVNSRTALFAAVPSGKIRYIVAIIIIGDGTASRTVHFEKLTGTTYSAVFPYVPIAPTDVRQLPPTNYDIENPIITCEDATLLYATANAGTPYAAVIYWDNER
jgi:hypothetical protein